MKRYDSTPVKLRWDGKRTYYTTEYPKIEPLDSDTIIITTAKGMVIRTPLDNIRVMGRAAQGVRIVKLHPGDNVTDIVKVVDAGINGNGNGNSVE